MRKLIARAFVAVAGLFALAASASAENLLRNPGFEQTKPGATLPAEWEATTSKQSAVRLASPGRSGERALEIEALSDSAEENYAGVRAAVAGPVGAGTPFVVTFYAKTDGVARGFCSYYAADDKGKPVGSEHFTPALKTEWTRYSWRFNAPAGAARIDIMLQNRWTRKGRVWFDDVTVERAMNALENGRIRVVFDPTGGGRVSDFIVKKTGRNLTVWNGPGVSGGLAGNLCPAGDWRLYETAYEMQVLEPGSRALLSCDVRTGDLAGLRVEKEYSVAPDSAALDVRVRLRNTAAEVRKTSFRIHNSLPPARGVHTWPCADRLHAHERYRDVLLGEVWIKNPSDGWAAMSDAAWKTGLVALFERDKVEKVYGYFGDRQDTIEWWYKEFEIPAGGVWETAYTLAVVSCEAPIVAACKEAVVGMDPLDVPTEGFALTVSPLRAATAARLKVTAATADGKTLAEERDVPLAADAAARVELPWKGAKIVSLDVRAEAAGDTLAASLSEKDRPVRREKVMPRGFRSPDLDRFPQTTSYFPFGGYLNAYPTCKEAEDEKAAWDRILREYRRSYMNTVFSGSLMHVRYIGDLKDTGRSWAGDLLRKYDMRCLPYTNGLMRTWKRNPDGQKVEVFPETVTREEILNERLGKNLSLNMEVLKEFARKYGDVVLMYVIEDEPQALHLPIYPTVRDIWRDIDATKPAVPILNLGRAEYLQYVPVHFGDLYPYRTWGINERNPWQMAEAVRAITTKALTPVWVMPQAFSTEPRFKNFRNPYNLPTAAASRLMVYAAVANGGKGIVYHGLQGLPAWRYKASYHRSFQDFFGAYDDNWLALKEAARHLSAIGPTMLQTDYDAEAGDKARVECDPFKAPNNFYDGPVISVSLLRQRSGLGHFLVLINQDIDQPRKGVLGLDADFAKGKVLLDLFDMKPAAASQPVELIPGDGRILFCGPAAEAQRVLAEVHANRCRNEKAIVQMDLDLAEKNGVNAADARSLAEQSAKDLARGKAAEALEGVLRARAMLTKAMQADADLGVASANLTATRDALSALTWFYADNLSVVVPDEVWNAVPSSRAYPENKQDPEMQKLLDATSAAWKTWMTLEARLTAGEAKKIAQDATALSRQAADLKQKATAYVSSKPKPAAR